MIPPSKFFPSIGTTSFTNSSVPRILLIFVALIGWLILIPPFALQVSAKNLPLAILCLSVMTTNMMRFSNAILWPSADTSHWWDGRVFCDIQIVLINFIGLAIPGGVVCLFRQLCELLNPEYAILERSKASKMWTEIYEQTLCIGLPILRVGLYYIVANDRYWILGLHGCTPIVDSSWPTIALYLVWPVILLALSLCYAIVAFSKMIKHHLTVREHVSHNRSRIKRLSVFCGFLVFIYTPYTLWSFVKTLPLPLESFSWSRVHGDDWWDSIYAIRIYQPYVIPDYCQVVFSIVVFACFGFGKDARAQYHQLSEKIMFRSKVLWRVIDDRFIRSWRWRK